ncbi:MAG: DUF1553 domain-containing protein [Planctomycetota bacterium]|nr:MAG: DUF1553 domain-containing protein [Planctomycetota bacterium]
MHPRRQRHPRFRAAIAGMVCLLVGSLGAAELPSFNDGTWPFCPPSRPAVPEVENAGWVANPIDAFVLAELENKGLQPSPQADKRTLLRRLTFDLTGLPPTDEQQQAFLTDDGPGAYERLVERLLDSPRYGERWAQHWLDIVRYAETDGFKADEFRPSAHKYRDYVIRAFNADLPYDRFIRQQLAGDELEPDNPEALVATGLNRLYPDESNAADVRQRRQEIHDDLTDTTSLALLGLTMGCARCHDHKFDPITQVDYFRLQSFFATLLPRDDAAVATVEQKRRYAEKRAVWEEATKPIRKQIDALLEPKREAAFSAALIKFDAEIRTAVETPPEDRSCMQRQISFQVMRYISPKMNAVTGSKLKGEDKQRYDELKKQLAEHEHLKPAELPKAMAVVDASADAPPTHRLTLGDYRKPAEEVQPGFPAFLGASEPDIVSPPAGDHSSGRRAALAEWLCRDDHPLTSRVMVNRIWQHHFGMGIVATPNDFGAMGDPPTHPDLLDWLAVEFVERGWSIKQMHRLMVTSSTYRQASRVDLDDPAQAKAAAVDPDNELLWHARRRRLEGEALRDAMLALSGELQTRMFGPSARPVLPEGVDRKMAWKPDSKPEQRNRRSIYVFAKRNLRYPILEIFDLPDLHNSCPQRSVTTTAPQALTLLNGEFSFERAQHFGHRLLAEHGDNFTAIVRAAWSAALSREPSTDEQTAAVEFLERQIVTIAQRGETPEAAVAGQSAGGDPARLSAVADLCHAIFNANEFLYVD